MSAPATSLALTPADRERLRAGAVTLGVELDTVALRRFERYAELLDRWQRTTNLVSCGTARELVDRHFLDSLACAWICGSAGAVADLGSGAGFPGIPLAIVAPSRRTDLVEPRRRRASFLREVRRALALEAVEVRESRAEDVHTIREFVPVDAALCRAVWSDEQGVSVAAPWIRPAGLLLALRSGDQPAGGSGVAELSLEQTLGYRIGRGPRRRVDVYRKNGEAAAIPRKL